MVPIAALWLPIVLSAVIAFIASSVFHMVLPVQKVAVETALPAWMKDSMEARAEARTLAAEDARQRAEGPVPVVSDAPRAKVLIVDDDRDILNLTSLLLGKRYEVYRAGDGRTGLALAREHMPDLILLDVYMEGMNGYEVCETLKADPLTKGIPVALFTAGVQRWEVERGYKAGADEYITKPFKPDELMAKVLDLISGVCQGSKGQE